MKVTVNGKTEQLVHTCSVEKFLQDLGYKNSFIAVAVNQNHIPRSQFSEHVIEAGDDIEILAPMSGG